VELFEAWASPHSRHSPAVDLPFSTILAVSITPYETGLVRQLDVTEFWVTSFKKD
jgi:uncharacterized protein YceK